MTLIAFLLGAGSAAAAGPCSLSVDGSGIKVEAPDSGGCVIHALPSQFPATPTRLLVDTDDGRHIEFSWDPADPHGLSRAALIGKTSLATMSVWHPAVGSTAIQFGNQASAATSGATVTTNPVSLGWTYKGEAGDITGLPGDNRVVLKVYAADPQAGFGQSRFVTIALSGQGAGAAAPAGQDPGIPAAALAGTTRSLALLPAETTAQVGQMVVDVVVRRANQGLLDNAVSQVRAVACKDDRPPTLEPKGPLVSLGKTPENPNKLSITLHHTCAALEVASGTTLAGMADALEDGLLEDVVAAVNGVAKSAVVSALLEFAMDTASGRSLPEDPQRVFTELLANDGKNVADDGKNDLLKLASQVLTLCRAVDGCDAAMIHDMVNRPGEYLGVAAAAQQGPAAVERLVSDGVALIRPSTAQTPTALVSVAADAFAAREQLRSADSKSPNPIAVVATAIANRDVAGAVGALADLGRDTGDPEAVQSPQMERVLDLVVAFAQFGEKMKSIDEADGTPDESRKARADAFSDLVEQTTDRSSRAGEWVFGVTSFAAVSGDTRMLADSTIQPLAVPVGMSFDHVGRGHNPGSTWGFFPVDLGSYLAIDSEGELQATDGGQVGLVPQIQAGITGLSKSTPMALLGVAGWDPTNSIAFGGVRLAVEVPLIDLAGFGAHRPPRSDHPGDHP